MTLNWTLVLLLGVLAFAHCQSSGQITKIRNRYAFMADKGLISYFARDCYEDNRFKVQESPSIETLINLVERLEDVVANTTEYSWLNSPDKVARMILHRFHLDSVNFETVEQDQHAERAASIDSRIIGRLPNVMDYNFPDYVYSNRELCDMLFMFSHGYLFQKSDSAVNDFVPTSSDHLIKERGVVRFRQDKSEAIAPARVFMGVIAGLTDSAAILSGKNITRASVGSEIANEVTLKNGLLAVTFGNLMGTASFFEMNSSSNNYDPNLIFGVKGTWANESCCATYYATDGAVSNGALLRRSSRGSLAQIRGSLDGYIIGKNLMKRLGTAQPRLSTILKSYYSVPHVSSQKFGISYCDRSANRPSTTELMDIGTGYSQIYNFIYSLNNTDYRGDALIHQLEQAVNTQEFCNKRPSHLLDKNSPCETPSDLIFVLDPKEQEMASSAQLISDIVSRINRIDRYGGTVSVFSNSNYRFNVELPSGPGGWPFTPLVFNSSNIGSLVCHLSFDAPIYGQTSMGKYLRDLNQTITNYKWWTPRRFYTAVPSKNVILLDYGTLVAPSIGHEMNDYNTFKEALKWDNRDVEYLVVSPNKQFFKDFVRDEATNIVSTSSQSIGATFAAKICENPATLIYNECEYTPSQKVTYEGYVTPGYKQNWAMYPEYFKNSTIIEFKVKALEGSIKYCQDRSFPPEKEENCKVLQENEEENFKVFSPCSGQSVHSCKPIYVTVWGKERGTICKDERCLSLDQAKFSIGHSGAYCNSDFPLN